MDIEAHTDIPTRSPAECLAFCVDMRNCPAWDKTIRWAEKTSDGPVAVGTTFRLKVGVGRLAKVFDYTVETLEPGRKAVMRGVEPAGTTSVDTATVEPRAGGGTRLTWHVHIEAPQQNVVQRALGRLAVEASGRVGVGRLGRLLAAGAGRAADPAAGPADAGPGLGVDPPPPGSLHVTAHVEVLRTPAECLAFAADMRNIPTWDKTIAWAIKTSPGPLAEGSTFRLQAGYGRAAKVFDYVVETFEPPRRAVIRGQAPGGVTATETALCEPLAGGGTRLTWGTHVEVPDLGVAARALGQAALQASGRVALTRMGDILEPRPSPHGSLVTDALEHLGVGVLAFSRLGAPHAPGPLPDRLDGRTVALTGATSGVGLAAAQALARLGANLILVGRHQDRLGQLAHELTTDEGVACEVVVADLENLSEVRRAAAMIRQQAPRLHALVNNASGLFSTRQTTPDGLERTLALNLVGPYLLTEELWPALQRAGQEDGFARVVNVLSGALYTQGVELSDMNAERGPYGGFRTYARAKRGLLALSAAWAERWQDHNVGVFAMHPGWVDTPGVREVLPKAYARLWPWFRSPEQGADTIAYLASARNLSAGDDLWFDRQPHATTLLPGTDAGPGTRGRLWQWLDELVHAADGVPSSVPTDDLPPLAPRPATSH